MGLHKVSDTIKVIEPVSAGYVSSTWIPESMSLILASHSNLFGFEYIRVIKVLGMSPALKFHSNLVNVEQEKCTGLWEPRRRSWPRVGNLEVKMLVSQLCPTLCIARDCSPPGASINGILQARILELPFPSPGDLSGPGIEPVSPALAGGFFTPEPPGSSGRLSEGVDD